MTRLKEQPQKKSEEDILNRPITGNLEEDFGQLKIIFDRSSDIMFREFKTHSGLRGGILFLDGMINSDIVSEVILKPLLDDGSKLWQESTHPVNVMDTILRNHIIPAKQMTSGLCMQNVVEHVLSGDVALFIHGEPKALFIDAKGGKSRSVEEPAAEVVIRGPRDGFTEELRTNTSLIRKRLKTPKLKMESVKVGRLSKTEIVLTYLDGIADPSLIKEVRTRMGRIDIDAILASGYIEELIEDSPNVIFPKIVSTERPDKLTANLLEGKVGIIVDNTPFALSVPGTFVEMMQASEDYYNRFTFTTMVRMLRFIFLVISLLLPSVYIALSTFHQEMIPSSFLLSMAASRESVPYPALVEALLMEISFEALREAGVRLPRQVGQAVSIVGALVIGQAAVEAALVSAPLVIVVSITGIASFIIPNFNQGMAIRLLRFPMMILAGTLGLFGVLMGVLVLMIHLASLRTFGVPYFAPIMPLHLKDLKDVFIRLPWRKMRNRPTETGKNNLRRMEGPHEASGSFTPDDHSADAFRLLRP